jgi:hypothetical protein
MNYQDLFNEQYVNQQYYQKIQEQRFYVEQQQEFTKMLNSLNDFMDSAYKIAPQYQQQAFNACICAICAKLYGNNN